MDKLGIYAIAEKLDYFGYWIDIIKLERVCKKWKEVIKRMPHRFSLQGYRSNPHLTAVNVNVKPIIESLFHYKLTSIDLRNVTISFSEGLGLLLLQQIHLKKLNLTNACVDLTRAFYILAEQQQIPQFKLEELRLSNNKELNIQYIYIAMIYPRLQRLYISNVSLSTTNLQVITSKMTNLRIIDISFNPITEKDLYSLKLMIILLCFF